MAQINLAEQAEKMLELAERAGLKTNFFFVATFADYQQMRKTLAILKKSQDEQGALINGKINPCIAEYNKTAQAAAALAEKLMKIISENMENKNGVVAAENSDEYDSEINDGPINFEEYTNSELKLECKKYNLNFKGKNRKQVVEMLDKVVNTKYEWL